MREVSNTSAVFLRDACAREQISFGALAEGLIGLERIDESGRIDWDVFAELLDRFAASTSHGALERAGARTADDAFAESIRVIAGAFASSRLLYRAIVNWFAPAAIQNLRLSYMDLADGRLRITVEVPAPFRPSTAFFHLTLGSYRAAPRLLGQNDALVEMDADARRAIYTISPGADLTLFARARRTVKYALGARRAIDELSRQQEELKTSFRALFESRRDLRNVIDRVPNGVLIHQGGKIVYANPSFVETLGISLVGKQVEDLVEPSARVKMAALLAVEDAPPRGRPVEVSFVGRDGITVALEVFPTQKVDFDGRTSHIVVAHDITARKELEAKAFLAERMASIGTIAASVAHEINNPLTYVIDNVRRIHETLSAAGSSAAGSAELTQMAGEAVNGAERVEVIVRDLKTFARADTETVAPIDVRAILRSAARVAASEISLRARLVEDFDDVPLTIANASRLGQVFLNLIVNAAQAIPEGNTAGNEIRLVTRNAPPSVLIEVKDTGLGIGRENLGKIFQPFFTTKAPGVGTGLGLAICQSIVSSLGGTISVTSGLGVGTTFRVVLPAAETAPPPAREKSAAPPPPRGPKRILVIDDEPLVANALKRALRGNEVTIALSGKDALDALEGPPFDLVFCDLMMPGISGMDVYERLTPEHQGRFVFATGGAYTPRARAFIASVRNLTIDKPFDPRLLRKIVSALDNGSPPLKNGGA